FLSCARVPLSTAHMHVPVSPFPYTTLFRSPGLYSDHPTEQAAIEAAVDIRNSKQVTPALARERLRAILFPPTIANGVFRDFDPRDRKSTRLNSSHVKISYAVFCLKKKKN